MGDNWFTRAPQGGVRERAGTVVGRAKAISGFNLLLRILMWIITLLIVAAVVAFIYFAFSGGLAGSLTTEAETGLEEGNWPIGCVIELNGDVIARAHNQIYTLKDRLAHAEMLALRQVQNELQDNRKKATLYTTYEPCPMCFGGAMLSRIKRVVCGIDLDNSGAMYLRDNLPLLFKRDNFHVEFTSGVLAEDCARIFMQSELAKKLNLEGLLRKVNL